MAGKHITVKIYRHDPSSGQKPGYSTYSIPFEKGMSAMDALDYIYQNLDGSIAYYDHAGCSLGICGRCTARINGKAGLLCQTLITGDVVIEPVSASRVLRDLVIRPGQKLPSTA